MVKWGSEKVDQFTLNVAQLAEMQSKPPYWGPAKPKPLVDSESLQAYINEPALAVRASKLYSAAMLGSRLYGHPTRVIGSGGHYSTLSQIESSLRMLGPYFNVTKQYFKAPTGVIFASSLTVNKTLVADAIPFDLTPPTFKKKPIIAPMVLVANQGCNLADYPAAVNGSIALIERGTCSFGNKSGLAGQSGAAGAIIFNNVPGEGVLQGTMGSLNPNQVATIGVSYEEGSVWAGALAKNLTLSASLFIDSFVKNVSTFNLIAETAYGDENNVVMLGAHSDSVAAGPGINDDGSGTISLIEVALALSNFNVTNKVRFAWWAGEEEGLLGSDYYVSQLTPTENSQIRLFMDYDMMASPNYAYQVYNASDDINPVGSAALKQLYIDFYTANNVNYTLIPFDGRSDYDGFIKNGIPGGGIATGAEGIKTPEEALLFGGMAGQAYDPCYHQLCDDTTNLNYEAWILNTKLIAHSVATYAASLKSFPLRESFSMTLAKNKKSQTPFHGTKLAF
ncbi:hypothetical protein D0Z00_004659 [Geotrichum galactomycetum]|uniref:Uncharacterized protein n=1 Tax=Geotrichum galactomycetum TaxID=27317 RepID=A0ACB6UXV0_9ASCO|nr:hypothetical protein D0Z00_004659 [Geotrichum candidum]